MSDDLTPVPKEEQLQKIDEAFEVERPNASIAVSDPVGFENNFTGFVIQLLDVEERLEAIEDTKQNRANRTQLGLAMADVAKLSVWGMIGWFSFVAVAITAYMACQAFSIILLPENALLALIATVAFATILGAVAKVIEALKVNSNSN